MNISIIGLLGGKSMCNLCDMKNQLQFIGRFIVVAQNGQAVQNFNTNFIPVELKRFPTKSSTEMINAVD